ncbi:aminodeoxychorismate synthase component I [Massilia arenosa]|uniref:Aminodeoxychorismate synthase component I n=1 Tax=Zemynaea arenosa TaxID=2561931 RepID=A0A4Y9S5K8_9BURK|nr:aminodeoxychorismate synthase component I [Massilia arenosa]TFW16824.1 aminodeoxychorismate synthase component I [Massilia arenosa]
MAPFECFALLDDASPGPQGEARSRLYTGHTATLRCASLAEWPTVLAQMQRALDRGLFAVPVLAYELGAALQGVPFKAPRVPLAQVLLFDRCEHLAAYEVTQWLAARTHHMPSPAGIARVTADVDEDEFTHAIGRIREYIAAGDTYQVNYTFRLQFDAFGTLPALYARLRSRQPVPYGALVALPDGGAVLSLSPELFVRHDGGALIARPMKGTAPATEADDENARRAAALAHDEKNRAENLMIVDLLRNDLGRICETGSVQVPALFDVNRYSSVLQMTSTVEGQLRSGVTLEEIFGAVYPCGSITGAPKRRTMEIIAQLEKAPRGVYTGAIGWFDPPAQPGAVGDFCLSVPIRTLVLGAPVNGVRPGEMGVGAGIVHDSVARDEFAECQLKASFLTGMGNEFELFETMRVDSAGCRHRDLHLSRMARSAQYFGFRFDLQAARERLAEACAAFTEPARVRLALKADGSLQVQSGPLAALATPVQLIVAKETVRSDEIFQRHKTTVRARYDGAWKEAEAQGAFDMVFFNERDELAEGGRSNVFVQVDGRWVTPPLTAGVLPGVMRALMLEDPEWDAREAVVTRAMFERASAIVVCNSLRGALRAEVII